MLLHAAATESPLTFAPYLLSKQTCRLGSPADASGILSVVLLVDDEAAAMLGLRCLQLFMQLSHRRHSLTSSHIPSQLSAPPPFWLEGLGCRGRGKRETCPHLGACMLAQRFVPEMLETVDTIPKVERKQACQMKQPGSPSPDLSIHPSTYLSFFSLPGAGARGKLPLPTQFSSISFFRQG